MVLKDKGFKDPLGVYQMLVYQKTMLVIIAYLNTLEKKRFENYFLYNYNGAHEAFIGFETPVPEQRFTPF